MNTVAGFLNTNKQQTYQLIPLTWSDRPLREALTTNTETLGGGALQTTNNSPNYSVEKTDDRLFPFLTEMYAITYSTDCKMWLPNI